MGRGWAAALGWAGLAAAAAGQPSGQPSGLPPGASKVEAGVGDRKLGVGRVDLRQDLRQQNDFGSVYRFTTPNPYASPGSGHAGPTMFMRIDGAVTAVFPESVYVPSRQGDVAVWPPGTTFYIGGLPKPWMAAPETPVQHAANFLELRADTAVRAPGPARDAGPTQIEPPAAPATIWNSEALRVRTVSSLIDRAASARP